MKRIIELNKDGTLPVSPRKEPEMQATTFHLGTFEIPFERVPNPKWRWWKFWEPKQINYYL